MTAWLGNGTIREPFRLCRVNRFDVTQINLDAGANEMPIKHYYSNYKLLGATV